MPCCLTPHLAAACLCLLAASCRPGLIEAQQVPRPTPPRPKPARPKPPRPKPPRRKPPPLPPRPPSPKPQPGPRPPRPRPPRPTPPRPRPSPRPKPPSPLPPSPPPPICSEEVCDGIDNDCNGLVDDGLDYLITCGVGPCQRNVTACVNGVPQLCRPGRPTAEVCDGIDNNCDGQVDEGLDYTVDCPYSGPPGTNGIGVCRGGGQITACVNGVKQTCPPEVLPTEEVCNGIDDNCNGVVDDNARDNGQFCIVAGNCPGFMSCVNGATVCMRFEEVCNGVDDDCDGEIDEGDPEGGQSCVVGNCAGETQCINGNLTCVATPKAEVCNGIDDNCDGQIDEGNPGATVSCVGDYGCRGFATCVNGQLQCFC